MPSDNPSANQMYERGFERGYKAGRAEGAREVVKAAKAIAESRSTIVKGNLVRISELNAALRDVTGE